MSELNDYLSSLNCFSPEQVDSISQLFKKQEIKKNETLVNTNEMWDQVVFIEQGLLRLYYLTPEGKEFNKGFFADKNLVWPMSTIAREEPSRFTVCSLENCQLWVAPFDLFESMIQQMQKWPEFSLPFVENLLNLKIRREAQFLLNDASSRYSQIQSEMSDYIQRIPDYHIASYLGITHIAFSRLRKSVKLT
ncbi:MAG: Crp/Fnr family transcriptional regulator [Saccharospirillaceae bacterium]|nr:Crp/Fnr family transcriptional regulator [Pseudomonadales bacterium]NRB77461.1 Crp/Fnr family transcriptional regulator [Saccharospirillaceae bacterium]